MNKFFTVLLCFGFFSAALSQAQDNGPIVLENFEDFTISDTIFTSDAGLPEIRFHSNEEGYFVEEEYAVDENAENTENIAVIVDDTPVVVVVVEEEEEEEEFTGGIMVDPDDFLQPHEFEEIPTGVIIEVEEEEEAGEFTEGIILNPDDFLVHETEDDVSGVEIIAEEENLGEWSLEEEFSVDEDLVILGKFLA